MVDEAATSAAQRLTTREATLILYRAAAIHDRTWWLRSLRLAQMKIDPQAAYGMTELTQLAADIGIDAECVRLAAATLARDDGMRRHWLDRLDGDTNGPVVEV